MKIVAAGTLLRCMGKARWDMESGCLAGHRGDLALIEDVLSRTHRMTRMGGEPKEYPPILAFIR
jgi:hypothetical protein